MKGAGKTASLWGSVAAGALGLGLVIGLFILPAILSQSLRQSGSTFELAWLSPALFYALFFMSRSAPGNGI